MSYSGFVINQCITALFFFFPLPQGTETAKFFESLVRSDPLFEIPAKRHLGLVVFRLKVKTGTFACPFGII